MNKINQIKTISIGIIMILIATSICTSVSFLSDDNNVLDYRYNKDNKENTILGEGAVSNPCEPGITIQKRVWDDSASAWSDYVDVMLGDIVTFNVSIYNPSDCYLIHFSGIVFDDLPDNLEYVPGSSTIYPEDYINYAYSFIQDSNYFPGLSFSTPEVIELESNTVYWIRPPSIMPGEYLNFTYEAIAVECGPGNNAVTAHPHGFTLVDDYRQIPTDLTQAECTKVNNISYVNGYPLEVSNDDGYYDVSASATVNVICEPCEPDVEIEKFVWNGTDWADYADVNIGDIVHFKAVIYNPSDCYIICFSGSVSDQLPSNLRYVNGSSTVYQGYPVDVEDVEVVDLENNIVTWPHVSDIYPGGSLIFYYNATAVDCGLGVNEVTAHPELFSPIDQSGEPIYVVNGSYDVSASATVNVICEPCEPGVEIEKFVWNGCEWAEYADVNLGDTVHFKAIIYNPSDCYLMHFSGVVFDQLPDNIRYVNGSSTIYQDWPNLEDYDVENNTVYWYKPPSIMPGENLTFYYNATAVDCGLGVNNLTVHPEGFDPVDYPNGESVSNQDGSYDVSDYASVNVICEPCEPGISIEKKVLNGCEWAERTDAKIGDTIHFKVVIYNPSDCYIAHFGGVVFDQLPDNLRYVDGSCTIYGDWPNLEYYDVENNVVYWYEAPNILPNGELVFFYNATVVGCGLGINNITAHPHYFEVYDIPGQDIILNNGSYDVSASAAVNVICPSNPDINVVKSVKILPCNDYDEEGVNASFTDSVRFKIEVTNNGDVPLNVTVSDSLPIGLIYDNHAVPYEPNATLYPLNGHIIYKWNLGFIDPDETVVITFDATIRECGELINLVEVRGFYNQEDFVSDSDEAFVFVSCPGIDIVKDVDKSMIHSGDSVTYIYAVINTGNSPLTNVVVMDNQGLSPIYFSGDDDLDSWLDVDEIWIYQATTSLTNDVTNIGNVTAEDEHGTVVYANDTAFVDVINPGISVTKKVSLCCVNPGDPVMWNITVENTGDVILAGVCVVDDNMGVLDSMIVLAPGEKKYYEYITNPIEETTNTVHVNGTDPLGLEVNDSDSATVGICEINIDFDVEKTVKRTCQDLTYGDFTYVHVNESVTFNISVENTGDVPLNVTVSDILPWSLDYDNHATPNGPDLCIETVGVPYSDTIYVWNLGFVDPGETVIITFRATVMACGVHVNTAVFTAVHDGYEPVIKQDNATVFALCPGIDIDKSASSHLVCVGDEVTYTYVVNNTGNCPLYNVVVTDNKSITPGLISGDDGDNILQTGETWVYTANSTLFENTSNLGSVSAVDELDRVVNADDTEFVEVVECGCTPDISIDKKVFYNETWSDNLEVKTNENKINVTFKITVENTGTCDLENISIIDTYVCGIEKLRDFTGDFISYEIVGYKIFFTVQEPFTPDADPIVILFNATIYTNVTNHVEFLANSTYGGTPVCEHDSVTITINDEEPVNNTGLDPTVEITTPLTGSIYFRGNHLNAAFLENAIVIGAINITVDANDSDGTITKIEFKVDGEVINTTTNNYYYWNEKAFGWRTITVKVTDDMGNTAEDSIDVFMLNRGK